MSEHPKAQAETRKLYCKLSEDERNERARQAVTLKEERDELEERAKVEHNAAKAKIKTLETQIDELATCAREGQERRDVDCLWRRDEEQLRMRLIRLDTGDEIDSRSMTDFERQLGLPRIGPEPKAEGA